MNITTLRSRLFELKELLSGEFEKYPKTEKRVKERLILSTHWLIVKGMKAYKNSEVDCLLIEEIKEESSRLLHSAELEAIAKGQIENANKAYGKSFNFNKIGEIK